jgi:hypothetical protein
VTEKSIILVFEKIPGWKISKIFLRRLDVEINILTLVICAGISFFIGYVMHRILFHLFTVGRLHVVPSEQKDEPYMFLELSKGVDEVVNKSYVTLRVVTTRNDISHK